MLGLVFIYWRIINKDYTVIYKVNSKNKFVGKPIWIDNDNIIFFETKNGNEILFEKLNIKTNKIEKVAVIDGQFDNVFTDLYTVNTNGDMLMVDTVDSIRLIYIKKKKDKKLEMFNKYIYKKTSPNGKYIIGIGVIGENKKGVLLLETKKLNRFHLNWDKNKEIGSPVVVLDNGEVVYKTMKDKIYIANIEEEVLFNYRYIGKIPSNQSLINILVSPNSKKVVLLTIEEEGKNAKWDISVIDIFKSNVKHYNLNMVSENRPSISWSKDSKSLILTVRDRNGGKYYSDIKMFDIKTSSLYELEKGKGYLASASISPDKKYIAYAFQKKEIRIKDISGIIKK